MGTYHRTLIFGNGNLHKKFLREIHKGDYLIGVDRAAYWLIENGIIPDVAVGDFDSATPKEFMEIKKSAKKILKFPSEKNWTDMELAIRHARKMKSETVMIFGGTGTRLDHTLTTMHLLTNEILVDETNRVRVIDRGRTILKSAGYRYVSVIPITKTIMLQLKNFKYDLSKTTIRRGSSRTVSNECIGGQGIIELFAGKAWVIESND